MPKRKITRVDFVPQIQQLGKAGATKLRISDNAQAPLDQDEYAKSCSGLSKRYQALQKRYTTLTRQKAEKKYKADVLSGFLFEIGEIDVLDAEWSDSSFHAIVDRFTVHNDGRLVFTFTNGSEETVMM